jgi:hypothetical protein
MRVTQQHADPAFLAAQQPVWAKAVKNSGTKLL